MSVFSVGIGGTSEVEFRGEMRSVSCRISIASEQSGDLILKSTARRKVLSSNEDSNMVFVPPVVTKPIDFSSLASPVFNWNETIEFNELFDHVSRFNIVFIFEIIDFTVYGNANGFVPIAWAYLRLHNKEGKIVNADSPRTLQLYSYPAKFAFSGRARHVDVVDLISHCDDYIIPAVLSVVIKRVSPSATIEVNRRPLSVFEIEKGLADIEELVAENDDDDSIQLSIDSNDDDELELTQCEIPKKLKSQIYPGDSGSDFLKFSNGGSFLAVAVCKNGQRFIDLFNSSTLKLVDSWPAHLQFIYELQFSRDDSRLLSVSGDGTAKVWSVESPHQPLIMPHALYQYTAKFHPTDNNYVFTAGYDGIIRVWDLNQKKNIKELHGHKTRINSLVFAPNGRRMFAGDANGIISIWRTVIENGELNISSKRFVKDDEINGASIVHLDMVRSNLSLLVHTMDDMIRVFDTKAMTTAQRYVGSRCSRYILRSTFSPDGSFVLSGSENGSVFIWTVKLAKSAPINEWSQKFSKPVTCVDWNPVMNMIAFGSYGDKQPILVFVDPKETKLNVSMFDELSLDSDVSI